tara:strand:- start:833 stop:1288 length:456 start_codon:yes stop_codon:yes gene_type:complete
MISTLINFIYLLSLVCWIGSIIFFSFFVAPVVFKTLERDKAGEVVGIIFPRYYMIGYVSGVLVLMALLLNGPAGLKWCAWGIMMVGTAYAGLVVNPKAKTLKEQLKDSSEAEKSTLEVRFKNLHSLSVKLNGAVLFSGLWLLWLSAAKTPI